MKLRFIETKLEDFKQGRTITYLANKVGITRPYLSAILNGRMFIDERLALKILDTCFTNAEKPYIADFFIKI